MHNSHFRIFLSALMLMGLGGLCSYSVVMAAPLFQSSGGWRRPSELPEQQQTRSIEQQQLGQATAQAEVKKSNSPQYSTTDVTSLRRDADELSQLAQSIPGDVDLIANGVLPKDVDQKLKRIDKLSKELRSRITH